MKKEKTSETKENKGKIPEKDDKKMNGFEGFYACPK